MEKVRLGDICDVRDGTHDSPKYHDSGYPLVTSKNLSKGFVDFTDCNLISKEDYDKINIRSKVDVGDILMPMIGTVGHPVIVQIEPEFAIKNVALIKFYKDSRVLNKYIKVLLESNYFDRTVLSKIRGGTQKFISLNDIRRLEIILPPISEQLEIVDRIEKVNVLIDTRKEQLEKLDELVKARFVELFGTIHDNKFGYEIKTLQDVCEQIKDGTHQTPTYTDDSVNGYKFLSSKDVTTGKIDWTHLKYIPEELHNELYARIAPRKGDILLAKNGTTGIAAIVDRDEIFDIYVSLALLRPIEINSVYLWAAINSVETKQQFDASLKGIGVPNLHLGEIKKARIIVPPIEEQNQFADFVEQIEKLKSEVKKGLEKLELLKNALMQEYFG